jgi:hypothetical protein
MSRELRPGELVVCKIVGAFLFASVSGFLLIKGVESIYYPGRFVGKSEEEADATNAPKKKPRQPSQSSRLTPQLLRPDPIGVAPRETKLTEEGLQAKGLEIANRLNPQFLETHRDSKSPDSGGVVEKAILTESFQPTPEQKPVTGKFASAESRSRAPLPQTTKPVTSSPAAPFSEEDVRQIQSRLQHLGFLSYANDGRWDANSKIAFQDFKLANRLANDDQSDLDAREKLNSPLAVRADQSFIGKWCRSAGTNKLRLYINSRGTKSSAGSQCVFHNIQAENGGWRVRATCAEGNESWNANGKITVTASKLVWASDRDIMKYSRCN